MASDQNNPLSEILTEKELLDLLGEKKGFLDSLRRTRKLPFCKITNRCRLYLAKDITEFVKSRRMVLDIHSDTITGERKPSETNTQNDDYDM